MLISHFNDDVNYTGGPPDRHLYSLAEAQDYFQRRWRIDIPVRALVSLRDAGRGPAHDEDPDRSLVRFDRSDLDRWAEYWFITSDDRAGDDWGPRSLAMRASDDSDKKWFVVNGDGDPIEEQLRAWGCEVHSAPLRPRAILQQLAREKYVAALLQMDWNVEAGIIAAALVAERHVPLVISTRLRAVPALWEETAILTRRPMWGGELRSLLKQSMPPAILARMNFSRRLETDEFGSFETSIDASCLSCARFENGNCTCNGEEPCEMTFYSSERED